VAFNTPRPAGEVVRSGFCLITFLKPTDTDWLDPSKKSESPVAKATFVRTQNLWKVFWMRRDLKWHGYDPNPEVSSIEAFLAVIDRDEICAFFG
jgi:hypothetical protein